jgi:hypothetical protein
MARKINIFKADFYNVFVAGNANSIEMARVFLILAVPVMSIFMIGLGVAKIA